MDQRTNFLALILLDALEDENESHICRILEQNRVDASYVPCERGISPLHYACGMANTRLAVDVAKRFLRDGADANTLSEEKMTPLHVAAMYGRQEIVKMLLDHGAKVDLYDDDRKTPVHYAIEECHFEVVQLMRDHIYKHKVKEKEEKEKEQQKQQQQQQQQRQWPKESGTHSLLMSESRFEHSLESRLVPAQQTSTPTRAAASSVPKGVKEVPTTAAGCVVHKQLLSLPLGDVAPNGALTPTRVYYNQDVTSPYYINITHRRHHRQPQYRKEEPAADKENGLKEAALIHPALAPSPELELELESQPVNIFTLTKENLEEFSYTAPEATRTRLSVIDTWREKVQRSRARQSILREFTDIDELVDNVLEHDHLNFTNVVLREKALDEEVDSGACGSASSHHSHPSHVEAPTVIAKQDTSAKRASLNISLGQLIQRVAQAQLVDMGEQEPAAVCCAATAEAAADSSYQTVPEMGAREQRMDTLQVPGGGQRQQLAWRSPAKDDPHQVVEAEAEAEAADLIRSPRNCEYFLQMTEAYVHTDDENGLVFYETKLLANQGNTLAQQRSPVEGTKPQPMAMAIATPARRYADHDTTATSQSTNLTLPLDYETDALRAELTTFGEPPGPITKSTKRLYIKRLIKYKRKTVAQRSDQRQAKNDASNEQKFSVELYRTLRSLETFERIADYMKYEVESQAYFKDHQNKREMREGHLKQSFIYMLIDPRVSCNLPGEGVYLEKFDIWNRFLRSIFYVGKGKTSRPYSHLYDAMKTHSHLHNAELQQKKCAQSNGKKVSIKKQPLNVDLFKSPPQKSSHSKKLDRILDIWGHCYGVVCLHVFHNIMPSEAYTREAAIIDALSLRHLTNAKRGDYYGPAKTWTMKEKKYLGIALLYKALQIYLAEGESQLSPSDLI